MHVHTSELLNDHAGEFAEAFPGMPLQWRCSRDWAEGLLSLTSVSAMLRVGALHVPLMELVRDGELIPPARFCLGSDLWLGNVPDTKKVNDEVANGASLVLNMLHHLDVPAAGAARDLQEDFGAPTSVTAFYTPRSSQGFAFHYDTISAFLVQIDGVKVWEVAPPSFEYPLENQRWDSRLRTDERVREWKAQATTIELRPGDVLWLPRGWMHNGWTKSERSWHITFGLGEVSYMRALRSALRTVEYELPELRQDMYSGSGGHVDKDEAARLIRQRFEEWFADVDLSDYVIEVMEASRARFARLPRSLHLGTNSRHADA